MHTSSGNTLQGETSQNDHSNDSENSSVISNENDSEFFGKESDTDDFLRKNENSIHHFLQYQQRIQELEGHPLLSECKSLVTSIFYNPKYPDQIIYLQKNQDNNDSILIEALIEKYGFGKSSVDEFISAIDNGKFNIGEKKQPQHNEDDKNLSISTFCNHDYPDQIVHLQQTQNDQLEEDQDLTKPNIPMLLKEKGFINIEVSISNEHKISSEKANNTSDTKEGGDLNARSTSGQGNQMGPGEPISASNCVDVCLQQTPQNVQQLEESCNEGNRSKSKAPTPSRIDNAAESIVRQRKRQTLTTEKQVPTERREPSKQKMFSKIFGILLVMILMAVLVSVSVLFQSQKQYPEHEKKPYHKSGKNFMDGIAYSTKNLVDGMGSVDLPPSNSIMKGVVLYKKFANVIENSPAFKDNGASIAVNLREFSQKIFNAGTAFEAMYRKGDMLFWVLETQINLILEKLNPSLFSSIFSRDDASYISERLEEINKEIGSFEKKIKIAIDAMEDAENRRDTTERVLFRGQTEAKKFIIGSNLWRYLLELISRLFNVNLVDNRDRDDATKHLEETEKILNLLHQTGKGLGKIQKLLADYRYSLIDAQAEVMDKTSITKDEIDKLKRLLGDVQGYHRRFTQKDEQITIDDNVY